MLQPRNGDLSLANLESGTAPKKPKLKVELPQTHATGTPKSIKTEGIDEFRATCIIDAVRKHPGIYDPAKRDSKIKAHGLVLLKEAAKALRNPCNRVYEYFFLTT